VTWRPAADANVAAYNPALLLDTHAHAFIEAKSGTHVIGYAAVHSAISNTHQDLDEHGNLLVHGGSNDGDGGSGASSVARVGARVGDRTQRVLFDRLEFPLRMEGSKTAYGHLKAIKAANICSSPYLSNELKGDSPPRGARRPLPIKNALGIPSDPEAPLAFTLLTISDSIVFCNIVNSDMHQADYGRVFLVRGNAELIANFL
jgi:hypothetical protein